ncbi:4'-phosphopantetheinyl transferase [Aulographum hederae CBS 113979]|uniref:holo-[acyl-carrier-protein] synthase n=1 Tax=Aulographum hederae CBS 113979 TaxID=1176131 RepID=A0A6G1GU80_9PEZI|nr:4'-phosphopantetheinyl transferase [Aulographum hederae CBS 113979]
MAPQAPAITCWLLDTRSLWPGDRIAEAAPEALKLISPEEREACCRKFHIQDARNSLASALLKRLFIAKTTGTPWKDIRFGRKGDPVHGKPCFAPLDGSPSPIEFNISHQAGLVALVGAATPDIEVGVDIVCVNERDEYRTIDKEGLDGFVEMYEDVFSQEELWDMKYNVDTVTLLDGTELTSQDLGRHDRCVASDRQISLALPNGERVSFVSDQIIDAKLRRFYSFYCYKEAYIKLDGEALLAKWIRELEFKHVRAPKPGTVARCSTIGTWGEKVNDVEVWLKNKKLDDMVMQLQSFEENFMIGVAAKSAKAEIKLEIPHFRSLHLEHDVMEFATMK